MAGTNFAVNIARVLLLALKMGDAYVLTVNSFHRCRARDLKTKADSQGANGITIARASFFLQRVYMNDIAVLFGQLAGVLPGSHFDEVGLASVRSGLQWPSGKAGSCCWMILLRHVHATSHVHFSGAVETLAILFLAGGQLSPFVF